MARARNIKPSFFTNDILAECPPLARLLFAGLWTIADREGRLENRTKKIKAAVLPYDDCDVEELLNHLEKHKFILRYQNGEINYIQILNFTKHQNPHVKETESTIPAPDQHNAAMKPAQGEMSRKLKPETFKPYTETCNPQPETKKDFKNGFHSFAFSGLPFQGQVISLDGPAFNEWFQHYSHDGNEDRFRGLIQKRDDWYSTQPYKTHSKWLPDTTKWLSKNKHGDGFRKVQ